MSEACEVSVVLCTAPADEAEALVDHLLRRKLIACANLVPVSSRYWWNGEIESGAETLLIMKAPSALMARLRDEIVRRHSYDVPEVLELPVRSGLDAYLRWVGAEANGEP